MSAPGDGPTEDFKNGYETAMRDYPEQPAAHDLAEKLRYLLAHFGCDRFAFPDGDTWFAVPSSRLGSAPPDAMTNAAASAVGEWNTGTGSAAATGEREREAIRDALERLREPCTPNDRAEARHILFAVLATVGRDAPGERP